MAIGESLSERLSYKVHSAVISPGVLPTLATDPAVTGGQTLRYNNAPLNLSRPSLLSQEKRVSRQRSVHRLGPHSVPFSINCDLIPKNTQDFFEAVLRGTWAAANAKTNTDLTSCTIVSSVATCGGSTWAAQGFRVGDVIRFTNMSVTANNSKNFLITVLSGTAATLMALDGTAPADNTVDSAFNVTTVGRKVFAPVTTVTERLFLLEKYDSLLDLADLAVQSRLGGFSIKMPASGIATVDFTGMARALQRYTTGTSPFFTSPTAAVAMPTYNALTSNGGILTLGAAQQGTITDCTLNAALNLSSDPAAFSNYVPGIFTNFLEVSGSVGGFWESNTLPGNFDAETEFEMSIILTDATSDTANFISVFMPRVKFTSFEKGDPGQGGTPFTAQFMALEKATTTGYDAAAISIQDSLSA